MIKNSNNEINESYINLISKLPPKNFPLEKINRRYFEDVSNKNAIFEDNHQKFEDIPRGSAILIDLNENKIYSKSSKF